MIIGEKFKRKILVIIGSLDIGGAETIITNNQFIN